MKKEMLINVIQPEECRIAIVEDGVLEELYVERTSQESYVGNIYKGRIVNIEPSIQAAFVDFGIGRNGFLHVSDVEPAYYRHLEEQRRPAAGGRGGNSNRDRGRGRRRPERREPELYPEPEDFEPLDLEEEQPAVAAEDREREEISPPADAAPPLEGPAPAAEEACRAETLAPQAEQAEASPPPADSLPPSEKPRFMESAERRTDKEEAGSAEPSLVAGGQPRETGPVRMETAAVAEAPEPVLRDAPGDEEGPTGFLPTRAEKVQAEFEVPHADTAEESNQVAEEVPSPLVEDEAADRELEEIDAALEPYEELGNLAPERLPRLEEEEEPSRQRRFRDGGRRGRPRRGGRPGMGRPKPLIQDIFKRGQEVLVQVIKEGIGTKGPTLSTYISIAGRYLVLMPGLNRVGVSRKIADEEARRRLRDIFTELKPPKGLGFIIRTAGMDRTKKELQHDLAYLTRLWQVVVRRIRKLKAPAEIYRESDMITRTIRDTFTSDIDTIWVDEPTAFEHAQEFLQIVMPRYANRIKLYTDSEPLFYKYGIEEEISRIQRRHVPLPNGGSIVIDQTEALVAIDVNSGNFRADNNAEETAYQMNVQAAKEIARQLRLRDLGGVIVNDFIDMREEKHRRDIERTLREAVRRDRARTKILKMSAFGIIEMTRQRIRPSLKRSIYQDCPHCHSTGHVKTCESMSIDVMRMVQLAAHRENIARVEIKVAEDVAHYLLNRKRKEIARLEESGRMQVLISGLIGVSPETLDFRCFDNNNNEVKFL